METESMFDPLVHLAKRLHLRMMRSRYDEQWVIGYRKSNGSHSLPSPGDQFSILRPDAGTHYADPFISSKCGKRYVFFESWTDTKPKGVICCAEVNANAQAGRPQVVLERDYHVSYPCLFEWQQEVFLIPETVRNKTIELYRAVEYPHKWEQVAVLMKNVSAVDTTIFEHDGRLWLFTAGLGESQSRYSDLHLFYADSLFGPWTPHPKNPVVVSRRSARPAGRLFWNGKHWIRPGQDCRFRYGYAITLNRVDVLNETEYRETPIGEILPTWLPGLVATHTLNQSDGLQVVDGKVRTRLSN